MRVPVTLAVLLVLVAAAPRAADPLAPLDFLAGDWSADASGPGGATGGFRFARDLQGRVIVRTNHADYPASGGRPASRHDDLMVIHAAGADGLRADYYDSEGHTIRYALTAPAAGEAVFLSDSVAGAPRYRLSYQLSADGVLHGRFEIAPPGKPDSLAVYLSWTAHRTGEPAAR